MTDRTSAEIFSCFFTRLASDIRAEGANKEYIRGLAEDFWGQSMCYDFSHYDLGCEDELTALGLARQVDGEIQYRAYDLEGWQL